jgi:hypothetical protein
MFAIVQNNEIVKTGGSIRTLFPNISFPAGGASAQFKADNGVVEVVSGEQKDQRFYWVTPANPSLQLVDGVPTFMFTNTPKELEDREESDQDGNPLYVKVLGEVDGEPAMVDSDERLVTKGLKSQFIAQAKDSANKALAATDWYVIRKAERDVAIPAEVVAERQAIIDACTAKEAAITAATTIEGLMTAVQGA